MRSVIRFSCVIAVVLVMAGAAAANDYFPQSVASGDPRPDSVVLWTRVNNPEMPDAIQVEVAADEAFSNVVFTRQLTASADNDWCLKVRVEGLEAYTTYFYRFVYGTGAAMEYSAIGRTKTAPTPDMVVPIRFAVVYGQDYVDRYYNSYLELLEKYDDEIDFVVHLGDYIYETTGGSDSVPAATDRTITFEDMDGVIPVGTPDEPSFAAASLANYRTIYRTFRSDEILQRVHERWPMVAIWDDHEFSNDSWGANGTYFNGRVDEFDEARRQNAERAYYEWMPTEAGLGDDGVLAIDAGVLYPNSGFYRAFSFGSLLDLVLTDTRVFRPDHLVPEDGFPGTIVVDEASLAAMLGEETWGQIRTSLDPYVDMDLLGAMLPILRQTTTLIAAGAYQMENPALDTFAAVRLAEEKLTGNVSTTYVNALYAAAGLPAPFTPEIQAVLPRGVSYLFVGKSAMFSSSGARTQVVHDTFNLLAAYLWLTTGGAAQDALGGQQTAWMQGSLLASTAAWKVLANSVMMTPMVVDFTNPLIAAMLPEEFPDVLRVRLDLNVEDFNGFPQKRMEILGLLGLIQNPVVISGDIHAGYVTDHGGGIYELTGPAISSATFGDLVAQRVASDPNFGQVPGVEDLLANLDLMMQVSSLDDEHVSPSDLVYADSWVDGFMVVDVTADALHATMYELPGAAVHTSYYDDPEGLDDLFETVDFTIENGLLIPGE